MARNPKFLLVSVATLGLIATLNGCAASAKVSTAPQTAAAPPPPPPPAPAPAPAPPPPPAPAPAPAPPPPRPVLIATGKAKIEGNHVKIPGELEFDVGKATLKTTPQSTEILNTLVDFMKQNSHVTKLRIEGHTDNSGSPDANVKLSQERADAVATWLAAHGVDKSRLVTQGYGQTHPLVDNDTPDHKAMNRRTEFHVQELDGKSVEPTPAAGATPAPTNPTH